MTDEDYSALIARLAPCPFCGKKIQDDPDALYPTWSPTQLEAANRRGFRVMAPAWTMSIFCNEVWTGCGASMVGHGATAEEATENVIEKWNRREE